MLMPSRQPQTLSFDAPTPRQATVDYKIQTGEMSTGQIDIGDVATDGIRSEEYKDKTRPVTMMASKIFYRFMDLPVEIQHMVWRLTLQPRIVEMAAVCPHAPCRCCDKCLLESPLRSVNSVQNIKFASLTELPSAMLICRTSRAAVIQDYPLCFASDCGGPQTRFNYAIDTLYLGAGLEYFNTTFLRRLCLVELENLKCLAISAETAMDEDHRSPIWQLLEKVVLLSDSQLIYVHHAVFCMEVVNSIENAYNDDFLKLFEFANQDQPRVAFSQHFPKHLVDIFGLGPEDREAEIDGRKSRLTPSLDFWSHEPDWFYAEAQQVWGWSPRNHKAFCGY